MTEAAYQQVTGVPAPPLRPYLARYGGYRIEDDRLRDPLRGLPSVSLTLILQLDEPLEVGWEPLVTMFGRFRTMIAGLHTRPAYIGRPDRQHGLELGLTPLGARRLFGIPGAALCGEMAPLSDLIGDRADRLYERVAAAPTWPQRFAVLDEELLGCAGDGGSIPGELGHVWDRLTRSAAGQRPPTVEELAAETGWSRRHLTARFRAEFGVGPKAVARIGRFTHAQAWIRRYPSAGLADAAYACGYADQAHLTREWVALGGCTPAVWRGEQLPFVQDPAATVGGGWAP